MVALPPWINVSPAQFLAAAQGGASAGAQVASIRNQAQIAREQMAQQAALASAARAQAAQQAAASMQLQQSEQARLAQQAQAQLAQQGQISQASMQQRALEAALRNRSEMAKQAATQQHYKTMEGTAADRLALPSSNIGRLQRDYKRAIDAGDTEGASQIAAAIQLQNTRQGRTTRVTTDEAGNPVVELIEGGGGEAGPVGKLTTAVSGQAQQKLLKYENSQEILNWLQNNLQKAHVGAAGVIGEFVLDRTLPQLGIETASGDRIEARTALSMAREGLLREVSDDSRFSNADRLEIMKALPSSGVFESQENALGRIKKLREIFANRGKVSSKALGLETPPIWTLSREELGQLYKSGAIDESQVREALRRFH